MLQSTIASYQSITIRLRRKTWKFTTCWNTASSLKSFIFLFETFFFWWLDCINLCICHFCWSCHTSLTYLLFWMNCLTQPITLNSLFQFENLLKSNFNSCCGTVWYATETIHVLIVFLNSKLLLTQPNEILLWPISFVAKQEFWFIPPCTAAR